MGYPDTSGLVSDDLEVIRTASGWLADGVRVALPHIFLQAPMGGGV
ncbi:MAG: hypothetical protein N0E55_03520 [Candidatus Thiodiazotropha taylori]|nr:hypothetical protein [Candidatus Thiodiazotropha taylori]MCW4251758.1 hypothetical protein [Candidatus Thiodiazotropha taylori]